MHRSEVTTFPNKIAAWRGYRRMTQDDLAEKVGVAGATISRIENGKDNFLFDVFLAIAHALDCSAADLLTRDPNTVADSLYRDLNDMPLADQKRLARFIKAYREGELG